MSAPLQVIDADTDVVGRHSYTLYSDGRDWDADIVAGEIQAHMRAALSHYVEAGKRFHWARAELRHGEFEAWCRKSFPTLNQRTIQRWMRAADFALAHPGLLDKLGQDIQLNKVTFLAQLPEEEIETLIGDGEFAGVPLEELGKTSYPDLVKNYRAIKRQLAESEEERGQLAERAEKVEERLNDVLDLVHSRSDETLRGHIKRWESQVDGVLSAVGPGLRSLAQRWGDDELGPEVRADLIGLTEWLVTYATHMQLTVRRLVGDAYDSEYLDNLRRFRPGMDRFTIPVGQLLPGTEEALEEAGVLIDPAHEAALQRSGGAPTNSGLRLAGAETDEDLHHTVQRVSRHLQVNYDVVSSILKNHDDGCTVEEIAQIVAQSERFVLTTLALAGRDV